MDNARDPHFTRRFSLAGCWLAIRMAWQASRTGVLGDAALSVLAGVTPVLTAWLIKQILDGIVVEKQTSTLHLLTIAVVLTSIVGALSPRVSQFAEGELGRSLRLYAKNALFLTLSRSLKRLGGLEDPKFHDTLRIAQDAGESAPRRAFNGILMIVASSITGVGFLVVLMLINPVLAIVVLAAAGPTLWAEITMSQRREQAALAIAKANRSEIFYATLMSTPIAGKELRLFGLGDFFRMRMIAEVQDANDRQRSLDIRELKFQSALAALGAVLSGIGLVWAVNEAIQGRLTVGDITLFFSAVSGLHASTSQSVASVGGVHNAVIMLSHYNEVLSVAPDHPPIPSSNPPPKLRSGIRFEGVSFRYSQGSPLVLDRLDLTLEAGKTTALIGANGSGKSTIIKLLCGLYTPSEGRILWDDIDIQGFSLEAFRQQITIVFQDFMIYELPAKENVGVGMVSCLDDMDAIEGSAERAGVHELLGNLPTGYDTMLTRMFAPAGEASGAESGVLLSGGQGQRVALARAFMRENADLWIADEPNAGLDPLAEADVMGRFRECSSGRTTLLVSHRLNGTRFADRILVLRSGRVVEQGSHDELMRRDGSYAEMFTVQAEGFSRT